MVLRIQPTIMSEGAVVALLCWLKVRSSDKVTPTLFTFIFRDINMFVSSIMNEFYVLPSSITKLLKPVSGEEVIFSGPLGDLNDVSTFLGILLMRYSYLFWHRLQMMIGRCVCCYVRYGEERRQLQPWGTPSFKGTPSEKMP